MSIGEILLRSRYQPLKRVLSYDVFNTGFNGWMTLMPNFTEYPDFDVPKTLVNKDQWPPVMLSSATFRYPGTHGAMSGTYSLKLSTRPVAAPYTEIPAEGCLGHAIKRLSFSRPGCKYLQIECWFTYTAEQDVVDGGDRPQPGLHESSIRDFGLGFDVQEGGKRYPQLIHLCRQIHLQSRFCNQSRFRHRTVHISPTKTVRLREIKKMYHLLATYLLGISRN